MCQYTFWQRRTVASDLDVLIFIPTSLNSRLLHNRGHILMKEGYVISKKAEATTLDAFQFQLSTKTPSMKTRDIIVDKVQPWQSPALTEKKEERSLTWCSHSSVWVVVWFTAQKTLCAVPQYFHFLGIYVYNYYYLLTCFYFLESVQTTESNINTYSNVQGGVLCFIFWEYPSLWLKLTHFEKSLSVFVIVQDAYFWPEPSLIMFHWLQLKNVKLLAAGNHIST